MKQYIFLLLSLLLASCTEKEITSGEPPTVPQTGFRLSARLGQGAATRAVGDAFGAQSNEKPPTTAQRPSPTIRTAYTSPKQPSTAASTPLR